MRVILFLFVVNYLLLFVIDAVGQESYICPMHPHIEGQHGDSCPVCGMTLVPKRSSLSSDVFAIDPAYINVLGIKVAEVGTHEFGKNIRAFGQVASSTRLEYVYTMREEGWVVGLAADAEGDVVNKGDLLFEVYSPNIITAQTDYLLAASSGKGSQNPDQSLRLVGMDDQAIALFKEKKHILEATPFHAPISGTVMTLHVRQGAYLNKGDRVMTIQDFSQVWVNAQVPLRDIQFLQAGTKATVIQPETGISVNTVIEHIHPTANPQSRTVMVRLVIDDPDQLIKPDSYVDVTFYSQPKARLAVPVDAVLYDGSGAHVIENVGDGYFRAIDVEVGITSAGFTEIKSGLSPGQHVVISGQFMLDAESHLRGAMSKMSHGNHSDNDGDAGLDPKGLHHAH